MSERTVDTLAWSPLKLGVTILVAVLVQLGLLSWFSAQGSFRPRAVEGVTDLRLVAGARGEWLALTDPTIFSRAHPDGFSGAAWLTIPPHRYLPSDSEDAPLWLELAPGTLGGTFREFVRGSMPEGQTLRGWKPPAVTAPIRSPVAPRFDSQVSVEGSLAARGIVSCPELPAWTNADVLEPSRVRVLVDARGNPVSAVLLRSSGLKAADQSALEIARGMRFGDDLEALNDPAARPDEGLASGWILFSWCTLAPVTNGLPNPR